MDISKIEFHFFLAAFVEMTVLTAVIATFRAKKKLPRKKYRVLMALEVFALWMLGTLLLAIGLALWIVLIYKLRNKKRIKNHDLALKWCEVMV